MGQSGIDKLFRFGAGLQLKEGSPGSLEAWFLGEKAENADEFERLIVEAIRDRPSLLAAQLLPHARDNASLH